MACGGLFGDLPIVPTSQGLVITLCSTALSYGAMADNDITMMMMMMTIIVMGGILI